MKDYIEDLLEEIEGLREWKELAYAMRNSSWWFMRRKHLKRFDQLHKRDWNNPKMDALKEELKRYG